MIDSKTSDEEKNKPLTIADIMFNMLNGILEVSEERCTQYLPEFMADVLSSGNKKYAPAADLSKGVDKFMIVLSDVCPDSPHMPSTFFKCIVKPLLDKKLVALDKMDWCE